MFKQFTIVALAACACVGAEPVELEFKFDTEKPFRFEMTQETEQTQVTQGQTVSTSNKSTMTQTSRLLEMREDGSVLIENTTDTMQLTISAPGVELTYDSEIESDRSKLSNPAIASAAGMVGMNVQLLIAPDGTIRDVPNVDQLQQRVSEMPDPAVRETVSQMVSEEAIRSMNEMNYKLLPEGPVEVGDEWSRAFNIPLGFGEMTLTMDLTLDSVEDGLASISIDGGITMPDIKDQGVTVRIGNASIDGVLRFNIEDGVQQHMDLTTSMKMNATMDGMGDAPVFTMEMTQGTLINRLDG